jgi:hypothetical protein
LALSVACLFRTYAGARFFSGKLEQSWKRFGQIVRHREAFVGMAQPETGREETLDTYVSLVWDPDCEEPWLLTAIREQDADKSRHMPGACVWKRRFKMAQALAGTSKPVGLWTGRTRDSLAVGALSGDVVGLASGGSLHPSRTTPARMTRLARRDKSIFRLGRLWLLDILRRAHNRASLRWCLPFQKMKTGWRFALRF